MRILLLLLTLSTLACGSSPRPATTASPARADLVIANSEQPGERMEMAPLLVKDKFTLVEFYSDACPPCREMARVLDQIAASRSDIAVRRLSIDRRGADGIDWDSPLAEQYAIESVPAFRIYGPSGTLVSEGDAARDQVREWYGESQAHQVQPDAGTREIMERYAE